MSVPGDAEKPPAYDPDQQPGYPPQQGFPPQQGYPPQQPGYPPQAAYNPQQGAVVTTAPATTVIVRNPGAPPSDYLVLAILVTIFCCLPFGIVGIIKAMDVRSRWAAGDAAGAMESSRQAKKWSIIGLVTGIIIEVLLVIFIVVYYVVILAAISGSFYG